MLGDGGKRTAFPGKAVGPACIGWDANLCMKEPGYIPGTWKDDKGAATMDGVMRAVLSYSR